MPRAFRQRITIRKRKLTTTRSTLMRHILSYRDWLTSSNAEVAFVRANFTAGRGHAWKAGLRDWESRQRVRLHFNRSFVIPAQLNWRIRSIWLSDSDSD